MLFSRLGGYMLKTPKI